MVKLACKICKKLLTKDKCPEHPDAKLTDTWKGRIIVLDKDNSELAKTLKINENGEYAIRV
ncbi:MAG: transcription elongation factor subunit Spt4 [Candidatus Nanoarchaeia archaeon]